MMTVKHDMRGRGVKPTRRTDNVVRVWALQFVSGAMKLFVYHRIETVSSVQS